MKVIAISDLHGTLIDIKESFDLLLICGDVCPVWCHGRNYQWEWLNDEFVEWVGNLPFKDKDSKVVMIAGNHDFVFESMSKSKCYEWLSKFNGRLAYLDNEEYTFLDYNTGYEYRIYGTPYCKMFGNWAFMRENLDKYYSFIPDNVDFLISHDAADIDELGLILNGKYKGTNAGNAILAQYVNKTKPKYYFCGHIHSGKHKIREINGTKIANVSILNENYDIEYEPLVLDI